MVLILVADTVNLDGGTDLVSDSGTLGSSTEDLMADTGTRDGSSEI